MRYDFLVDSYATERIKVLSVWSEFRDDDLPVRPSADDARGRSVLEQMVLPALACGGYHSRTQVRAGARPGGRSHRVDAIARARTVARTRRRHVFRTHRRRKLLSHNLLKELIDRHLEDLLEVAVRDPMPK